MTEDKEILINDFREKFRQLITICDRLREENSALKSKNTELLEQISIKDADLKQLSLKYENLRTVNSLVSGSDAHDTKIKLNRIVREIDRCLSLLNN